MKVVEINACKHGSTGNIMLKVSEQARSNGITAYTFSGPNTSKTDVYGHKIFGNKITYLIHRFLASVFGFPECFSILPTVLLVKKIKKITPAVIHLHNLHGWFINLPILLKYIKKNNIRVIWTLHDCWAFTGHCPHFETADCEKWKSGCYNCPKYKEYPSSFFDDSKRMYNLKNKWFTGVKDLTIVTPSKWLADKVKESFLKDYPVKVINNGIDLSVFKPTESDFRKKHNLEDKFILLGVAFGWDKRKGLDVFVELSKRLDGNFQIVLVGTNDDIDKQLPDNIISIHRTANQKELAEIYTAADLFVNPTREENYPTVNMESLACGTPVLTFNTGGSPECIDENCGIVVPKDDIEVLHNEILRIHKDNPYSKENCLKRAESFDMHYKFKEYVDLYKE